jgi:pimeloyl-ACP methyl ester carboxylesterase
MIQSFIASSTPPGIIQYVGSRESAQDFESIREALGYDKIHFIGCSTYVKLLLGFSDYTEVHWDSGSYRVAQYASEYPQRVGRFILDAISPHGMVRRLTYLIVAK